MREAAESDQQYGVAHLVDDRETASDTAEPLPVINEVCDSVLLISAELLRQSRELRRHVLVVRSTFLGGRCSNGGALSSIGVSWSVVNSAFRGNRAIGRGANPARAGTAGGGNGGAIALGHPVGATGGRLVLTALKELQRRNGNMALVTLCIGGGQGGALVLERS